jgi:hypothetical protein
VKYLHGGWTLFPSVGQLLFLHIEIRHQDRFLIRKQGVAVFARPRANDALPLGVVTHRAGGDLLHAGMKVVVPVYIPKPGAERLVGFAGRTQEHPARAGKDQHQNHTQKDLYFDLSPYQCYDPCLKKLGLQHSIHQGGPGRIYDQDRIRVENPRRSSRDLHLPPGRLQRMHGSIFVRL